MWWVTFVIFVYKLLTLPELFLECKLLKFPDHLIEGEISPGQYNYVVCAILAKLIFFFENIKWQTILHIFMKNLFPKKWIIFVKFKKQNVCTCEFSCFAKKVLCTRCDVLGILALILGIIFNENNLKLSTFLYLFIKKLYLKNE